MSDILHATMLIQNSQTSVHQVLWLQYCNDHKLGGMNVRRGEKKKKKKSDGISCQMHWLKGMCCSTCDLQGTSV